MKEDMRGRFFIAKGQYCKTEPSFTNKASGSVSYIGGYDPYNRHTAEWYMLMDCKTFHCVACGGSLDKILKALHTTIVKSKGDAKRYFKHVSSVTSEDYYEIHYLGHKPLSLDQLSKKAEGRCPRVSPVMKCLYEAVYNEYGDFFSEEIEEVEDRAYEDLKGEKPINKSRKLVSKNKSKIGLVKTIPKKDKVVEPTPPKKLGMTKVKMGVKKLKMV